MEILLIEHFSKTFTFLAFKWCAYGECVCVRELDDEFEEADGTAGNDDDRQVSVDKLPLPHTPHGAPEGNDDGVQMSLHYHPYILACRISP